MANVFITKFSKEGKAYTAVISKKDGLINIFVPDKSLHDILPEGKITFDRNKGLKISAAGLTPVQQLTLTILSAVELDYALAAKNDERITE